MPLGKAVIGQSGGPTAVINRSLVGFIKEATKSDFDEILGAKHGLEGMLNEDFVDLSNLSEAQLYGIGKTPAAAASKAFTRYFNSPDTKFKLGQKIRVVIMEVTQGSKNKVFKYDVARLRNKNTRMPVSNTHLTLPTNREV